MPILGIMASQISGHLANPAYESIATVNASGASNVSFTSIGSGFKHLQIRFSTTRSTTTELAMRLNGDTGNNYSIHYLTGDGATASAEGYPINNSRTYIGNDGSTTQPNVGVIDILDYTNTNKLKVHKTLSGIDKSGSGSIFFLSGIWNNTAAVTQVDIFGGSGTLTGKFALYGIKG